MYKRTLYSKSTNNTVTLLPTGGESLTKITVPTVSSSISVIIPTYNEAENIAQLLLRLDRALTQANIRYEAIVVDDRSSDQTVEIARELATRDELPVKVLIKQGERGKSFSLIEGFAAAKYDLLAMIDGDLQYPPEALVEMVAKLDHSDIVVGDRRKTSVDSNKLRTKMSRIFVQLVMLLFGINTDMQSGLKLFRRKVYDSMVIKPKQWDFDLYLVVQAVFNGYVCSNVPIVFQPRFAGVSKVSPMEVAFELLLTAIRLRLALLFKSFTFKFRKSKSKKKSWRPTLIGRKTGTRTQLSPEEFEAEIDRYTRWLTADAEYNNSFNREKEMERYAREALKTTRVGEQKIRTFAPFRPQYSAFQTFSFGQIVTIVCLGLACLLGLIIFQLGMVTFILGLLTLYYLSDMLLSLVLSSRTLVHSSEEQIEDSIVEALDEVDWPSYTILCPLYKEAAVVPQFVQSMQNLDYPADRLQVLFLTEEDDAETRNAIKAMRLPRHFEIVTVPDGTPRTKPRACNFGLLKATGDYVVIYDAEDMPDPLQLKKAILTFANHGPELGCVQAKLNFYNAEQNVLTRWFTAEYCAWYEMTLPGLQKAGVALPLGGTSNHFRTSALRLLGAWDAFNVTEDCDLGLRMAQYGMRTVVLDSVTYEEANSRRKNWLRQRSRWIKGYMQTYLVYMRNPTQYIKNKRWSDLVSLQVIIGGRAAVLLLNPVMWILTLIYFTLRFWVSDLYESVFIMPILYMGTLSFIFGNFLYIYTNLIGCLRREQYRLVKWTLLMPIYWVMMSISSFIALYQLITKPHYWEKTTHGLHLTQEETAEAQPAEAEPVVLAEATEIAEHFLLVESNPVIGHEKSLGNGRINNHIIDHEKPLGNGRIHTPTLDEAVVKNGHLANHAVDTEEIAQNGHLDNHAVDTEEVIENGHLPSHEMVLYMPFPLVEETVERYKTYSLLGLRWRVSTLTRQISTQVQSYASTFAGATHLVRPAAKGRLLKLKWPKDPWLLATLLIACVVSLTSFYYFWQNSQILLYGDSYSHMLVARRLFDNTTPGLGQLGGVWLPLPHLAMLPFIWNNYLWSSGLAGSFVSMPCYLIGAVYVYLLAFRMTRNRPASFVGALVFILNPNILYLQSTPLSELMLIATMAAATYHFLAWIQERKTSHLVLSAGATLLATVSRYDGWFLFLTLLGLLVVIGVFRRYGWARIEANILIYGTLGSLGIVLWLLWNFVIFGDPLYFQRGPFSAQAQQKTYIDANLLFTYHNVGEAFRYFTIVSIEILGPAIFVLAALSVLLFLIRGFRSLDILIAAALLMPFFYYVVSLYTGQAALFVPEAMPADSKQLFNVRYGAMIVVPAGVFMAVLANYLTVGGKRLVQAGRWSWLKRSGLFTVKFIGAACCILIIVVQSAFTAAGGIITVQEGQFGTACIPQNNIVTFLSQYYAGGKILEDSYTTNMNQLSAMAQIDFKNFIYEGSGKLWDRALVNPGKEIDWIIVNPTSTRDTIAKNLDVHSPDFTSVFQLQAEDKRSGLQLYYRKSAGPLGMRADTATPAVQNPMCGSYKFAYFDSHSNL